MANINSPKIKEEEKKKDFLDTIGQITSIGTSIASVASGDSKEAPTKSVAESTNPNSLIDSSAVPPSTDYTASNRAINDRYKKRGGLFS